MALHPPVELDVRTMAEAWTPDPWVGVALVVATAAYATGTRRLWASAGAGHGLAPRHVVAYGAGLLALALALVSPLDTASDALFSAHMIQHELIMLIAAPLLVLGRPALAFLWALPRGARHVVRGVASRPLGRVVARVLSAPLVVLVLHGLTRWAWHMPAAFDAALADERVHALQHASFCATAALFWWCVLQGRFGRAGYGVGVAFVFVTMLSSGVLAAMLSLSGSPWYAAHEARTAALGMEPVADQRRAGLFMWVPAGVIMTGTALALLAAWLGETRRRMQRSPHPGLRSAE